MKISASVILYHPTQKDILNLNTYINFVDIIYIYDNTENTENILLLDCLKSNNYKYIPFKENKGLCFPLNDALNKSFENGSDFLLTMDQDSYFLESNLKKYINDINNFNDIEKVGQFGLNHNKEEILAGNNSNFEILPYLITSGTIININAIKQKKIFFDENLFIDCVDFDFSFQIVLFDLLNINFTSNYFVHNLGTPVRHASIKSLYLIKKTKVIHSPIRLYYMQRNTLYLENKYFNSSVFQVIKKIKKTLKSHIKLSILYAKNPITAISYVKKGKEDYHNKFFGKINNIIH